jgi:hypothetical protein
MPSTKNYSLGCWFRNKNAFAENLYKSTNLERQYCTVLEEQNNFLQLKKKNSIYVVLYISINFSVSSDMCYMVDPNKEAFLTL